MEIAITSSKVLPINTFAFSPTQEVPPATSKSL